MKAERGMLLFLAISCVIDLTICSDHHQPYFNVSDENTCGIYTLQCGDTKRISYIYIQAPVSDLCTHTHNNIEHCCVDRGDKRCGALSSGNVYVLDIFKNCSGQSHCSVEEQAWERDTCLQNNRSCSISQDNTSSIFYTCVNDTNMVDMCSTEGEKGEITENTTFIYRGSSKEAILPSYCECELKLNGSDPSLIFRKLNIDTSRTNDSDRCSSATLNINGTSYDCNTSYLGVFYTTGITIYHSFNISLENITETTISMVHVTAINATTAEYSCSRQQYSTTTVTSETTTVTSETATVTSETATVTSETTTVKSGITTVKSETTAVTLTDDMFTMKTVVAIATPLGSLVLLLGSVLLCIVIRSIKKKGDRPESNVVEDVGIDAGINSNQDDPSVENSDNKYATIRTIDLHQPVSTRSRDYECPLPYSNSIPVQDNVASSEYLELQASSRERPSRDKGTYCELDALHRVNNQCSSSERLQEIHSKSATRENVNKHEYFVLERNCFQGSPPLACVSRGAAGNDADAGRAKRGDTLQGSTEHAYFKLTKTSDKAEQSSKETSVQSSNTKETVDIDVPEDDPVEKISQL